MASSMLLRFPGVALVTGAGGTGIGASVCRAFARAGCTRMAITDINKASLARTREAVLAINPEAQVTACEGDIQDEHFVQSLADLVRAKFARLDYAVNCAGILGKDQRSTDTSIQEFDRVNGVNYRGTWLTSRAALAQMPRQDPLPEHPKQRGAVVNIASQLGILARPGAGKSTSKTPDSGMRAADVYNNTVLQPITAAQKRPLST